MHINQSEEENFFRAFRLFREAFSSYIISVLTQKVGDDWISTFVETLSPKQKEDWTINLRNGSTPEKMIDFQHFKSFIIKNKDLVRDDFRNKTNDLPTWLGEIATVRNKNSHSGDIEEDEAAKAWIHLRTIARMIGRNELEQEIRNLEKSKTEEKTQVAEIMFQKKFKENKIIETAIIEGSKYMDENIKSAVDAQSDLSFKLNKGEHYRIMKTGHHGSLWIFKTERRGYRVETTGSVGTSLNPEIRNLLGKEYDHESVKGYKIWFVDTVDEVKNLLTFMDESKYIDRTIEEYGGFPFVGSQQ